MSAGEEIGPGPAPLAPEGAAGRADLFRALDRGGEDGLSAMARILGYEAQPRRKGAADEAVDVPEPTVGATHAEPVAPSPAGFERIPFWRPVAAELSSDDELGRQLVPPEESPVGEPEEQDFTAAEEAARRAQAPIVAWPRLWRVLDDRLRTAVPRAEIDVGELIKRWARGQSVDRLPRLRGLAHAPLVVVLDLSPALLPFRFDQLDLAGELLRRLGSPTARLVAIHGEPDEPILVAPFPVTKGERVLALTDLGSYGQGQRAAFWERLGEHLRRSGVAARALVPCPRARWPRRAAELWSALEWSAPARPRAPRGRAAARAPAGSVDPLEILLRLASPAIRLETGLLRDLRRLVPGAGVEIEVELWRHAAVAARSRRGLSLKRDEARSWRLLFRELPEATQRAAIDAIAAWHSSLAPEIWAEEVLELLACGVPEAWLGKETVEHAVELFQKLCLLVERGGENQLAADAEPFYLRFRARASRSLWSLPRLRRPLARAEEALRRRRGESEPPAGSTPEMFIPSAEELERWTVWQEGPELRPRRAGDAGKGSPLAMISAHRQELLASDGVSADRPLDLAGEPPRLRLPRSGQPIEVVSDVESMRLESWRPPEWASAAGRDEYGLWAAFEVGGVSQRLRWIPPGRFLMGSPETEAGRWHGEGPRHWVVLTEGFWLAETPCTQELWQAVMGPSENPSLFEAPRRSVEQVSWKDCQAFIDRLNFTVRGLEVRMPTEAEWEYACRAGTDTATWLGELEILGERNAPLLDDVAWDGGNSGVGLKPVEGVDASGWKGKQHPAPRAATREVGLKHPNPWGLYDMLGNVFEWCWDPWGEYPAGVAINPEGPKDSSGGARRVLRGGSWLVDARYVRAASRIGDSPGGRDHFLGFRLSRGRESEWEEAELRGTRGSAGAGRGTSPRRRSRRELAWVERLGWAAAGGVDRYGRWASFEVDGVEQRMRWIVPGSFLMGSPESEAGRYDDEGPLHEVTLTAGFWLGETPCTQALWQAVMGRNPSRFESPRRPVEQVSWEDCLAFLDRLNGRLPELSVALPTEAQWEYACRAGTGTATWLGDLRILGQCNAPLLDDIAWYAGNSGVQFDLGGGVDSSDWPEKQYPHTRAGTREVGLKQPNPWGLCDMLGNVHEWCSDDWADRYPEGPQSDPTRPDRSAGRVIRGGSWGDDARCVRAACRFGDHPDGRNHALGFRLSRGQEPPVETKSSKDQERAEPESRIQRAWRRLRGRPPRDEA